MGSQCGEFPPGTRVEYYSQTASRWVPAVVLGFRAGTYQLDIHPGAAANKVRRLEIADRPADFNEDPDRLQKGAAAEYYSTSYGTWVPAEVLGWDAQRCAYILNIQPVAAPSKVRRPHAPAPTQVASPESAESFSWAPCDRCEALCSTVDLVYLGCHAFCGPCLYKHFTRTGRYHCPRCDGKLQPDQVLVYVLVFLCVLEIMQLRSSGGSTTAAAPLRAFSRRLFAARRAVQEACALFRPREGMRCPHFTGPAVPVFSFNLKDDNAADFFARRWNVDIRLANAPQEEVAARGVACESLLSSMNGAMHGRRLSLPSWKVITPNRGWCQTRSPHVKVHQSGSRDAAPSRWPNRPVHGEFFASASAVADVLGKSSTMSQEGIYEGPTRQWWKDSSGPGRPAKAGLGGSGEGSCRLPS
eukprot:s203_g15.t1